MAESYTPDPALVELAAAIRDRLDDLGVEGRDQEGNLDGSLWLDGLDAVAADLARTAITAVLAALATEGRLRRNYDHDWYPDHDGLCVTCHLPGGQCPASPATRAATARITLAAVQGGSWLPAPTETKEN